jgi:2'-hydroxyisoflavone reductase
MRLLVLGGSQFVGRHIVEAALERGHSVTLFNRGRTNPNIFDGVEEIHGDRDGGLSALDGQTWDAVIDTSGYLPRVVGQSAAYLSGRAKHYVFISTISVYKNPVAAGSDEDAPLDTMEDETSEDISAHYGALKVLCEKTVDANFDGTTLHIRPGMIIGPYDHTDRFTWWVHRIAQGGDILAPGNPGQQVQFVDGRDLANFTLDMTEAGTTGHYNVTGPNYRVSMSDYFDAAHRIMGSDAWFTWASDEFLQAHEVTGGQMPFWIPEEYSGLFSVSIDRALAAGLRFRPLDDTIRDLWAWSTARDADAPKWSPANADNPRAIGLTAAREAELLDAWNAEQTSE